MPASQQQQQQQQQSTPAMLLYAIDATDCHNLKLFLQRCRIADVSRGYALPYSVDFTSLNEVKQSILHIDFI